MRYEATAYALSALLAVGALLFADSRAAAQGQPAPPAGGNVIAVKPFAPSDSTPSTVYWLSLPTFHDGDYIDAYKGFASASRGAIKTANSRWIDSICYFTMAGECFYQRGMHKEALFNYTSALQIFLQHSNWMSNVNFNKPIRPANPGRVYVVPWGQSQRNFIVGAFPDEFPIQLGRLNNHQAVQQGGVVQLPVQYNINVHEIVRCTCLAIRRRGELLGPTSRFDPLFQDLLVALRGVVPLNHWSRCWIDAQLGLAYAAAGQDGRAGEALLRAIVADDKYDHPLTPTVLLELGRLALREGNFAAAGASFMEATYCAVNFGDAGVLEEAFRLAALTHQLTTPGVPCAPLAPAANWARAKKYRQFQASVLAAAAENACTSGNPGQAPALVAQARSVIGNRPIGKIISRLNYALALANFQVNNLVAGEAALGAALKFMSIGSLWQFHINLTDELWMHGDLTPRDAMELYRLVLRDPTPADWMTDPLECLSVLTTPHGLIYEHWFLVAMRAQSDPERAFEIAELCKRHRFLSTLDLGGRLLNLRWLLDGPHEMLDESSRLERDDLLARYPAYQQMSQRAVALREELKLLKFNLDQEDQVRDREAKFKELAALSQNQELLLRELALRREPGSMVFPPVRNKKEIQLGLRERDAVLSFFTTFDGTFAFLLGQQDNQYRGWYVEGLPALHTRVAGLLKEMGLVDQNKEIKIVDLQDLAWQDLSKDLYKSLLSDSAAQLSVAFDELLIVPDGVLWYAPFEALLVPDGAGGTKPMLAQMRLRYAPLASLGVSDPRPRRQGGNTAVALGKLYPRDEDQIALDAFDDLQRVVPGAEALSASLPAASGLVAATFDRLIVYDDIKGPDRLPYDWQPLRAAKSSAGSTLWDWMSLPWGAPEIVALPGFHTPAESALKKTSSVAAGADLFLSTCGLMATGARTVLISRWRTGGQTSFNLVREFTQELATATAPECWQRSVLLARTSPLVADAEPRVKKDGNKDLPTAEHPFFWAGYILVDAGTPAFKQDAPQPGVVAKRGARKPEFGGPNAKMQPEPPDAAVGADAPARAKVAIGANDNDNAEMDKAPAEPAKAKNKRGRGKANRKTKQPEAEPLGAAKDEPAMKDLPRDSEPQTPKKQRRATGSR